MSALDIRRGDQRAVTTTDWLTSRHSFSFGPHYDAENLSFGLLQVHNDDELAPHSGYDMHAHREMEIVTWVLRGELTHTDDSGHARVVRPGQLQYMSAGRGVRHSERNETDNPARFVQVWLLPGAEGRSPSYTCTDVEDRLIEGRLVTIASGDAGDDAPVVLRQPRARFSVARPAEGDIVEIAPAELVHLYLATGGGAFGDAALREGDAVRLRADGGSFVATTASELLVWSMTDVRTGAHPA